MNQDYYEILGISRDATQEEVAKAYRALATKYHPDKNLDNPEEASKKFKEINKAYETLNNPDRRAKYDRLGGDEDSLDLNNSVNDIFDKFFHRRARNELRAELVINLEDILGKTQKTITVKRNKKCTTCNGSGATKTESCEACKGVGRTVTQQGPFTLQVNCSSCKGTGRRALEVCENCKGGGGIPEEKEIVVTIPAGVENGMHIKVPCPDWNMDVFVLILIKNHSIFGRQGSDLICQIPVTYTQLALGAVVEVPTINCTAFLKIPPKCQSGTKLKLRSQGLPMLEIPNRKGDLYVIVNLEIPKTMSEAYKYALEKLASLEKEESYPKIKEFKKVTNERFNR